MKQAYFFIDDFIWTLRDIARQKPASLFDNVYFKMLKEKHDKYGMTVQLNLFYRTDFFYDEDEFTLSEFPDCYKSEFEENSHWLKLAFHATQEFPNYPYINADYETVKIGYERVIREIKRFAGEKSISDAVIMHWLPISRDGVHALVDCGVKFLSYSSGDDVREYTKEDDKTYVQDGLRVRHNRKPETRVYTKTIAFGRKLDSLCAYNHLTEAQNDLLKGKNISIKDEKTGIRYRSYSNAPTLNLHTPEQIKLGLEQAADCEFIGIATHEQYYYPEYFNYQPDTEEKFEVMAKTIHDLGFTFITCEDFK